MTDYLNTKIVKDQQPAGHIVKSKKESGILTDGNSVDVYTDNGLRRIWLDSRIWLEGNPVANQDTIGVMSNPSNNSSVRFKLGADGNQELETSTGFEKFKPLSKNSPWFQRNLDRIREVLSKARFKTDSEDELRWRSQYEADGGKMKKKLMRQGGRIIEVPFENK